MKNSKKLLLVGAVSVLVAGGAAFAFASPENHVGKMMHGGSHVCEMKGPLSVKMVEQLERAIKPTDTQKPEVDALKAAVTKAQDGLKASCDQDSGNADLSPPGRLATMEKNLSSMLEAVKIVRPAADALYAKLDDKQRDALRWAMPMDHHGDGMMKSHGKELMKSTGEGQN
ncbi:MAG: Spy/CpxP family protein refolding chaperone [Hyphomicrobiales bacterium]|nr:Spy/CpxP family protein refolding chaperone [Hyphomicrobiales bacterium]